MRLEPPTYFFILLILAIAIHFILPIKKIIYAPYSYTGIILILFGIIFNILGDSIFKKRRTTIKPNIKPTVFVTSGPFKISRHPMYLGMAAILFGTALVLGSIIAFIFPIIFIILMGKLFIQIEEKNMEKAFGKKYLAYKKKVRRWI